MVSSPSTIIHSTWIGAGLLAWFVAQGCKLIHSFVKTKSIDFTYFVSTGGMPSAHSAAVCGVAWSIGLTEGFGTPVFAVAFTIACVTMFDASTLRLNAGRQAQLLNEIAREVFAGRKVPKEPLRELLGHTPLEVLVGMLVGILVATIVVLWTRGATPTL